MREIFTRKIQHWFFYIIGLGFAITPALVKAQVKCAVTITVSPAEDQFLCETSTANTLTATITNNPGILPASITYQWFSNPVNANTGGSSVQVVTTTTSTTTNNFVPPSTVGTLYYYCRVTNNDPACFGTSVTTGTVEVNVIALPFGGTLNSGLICSGASGNVILSGEIGDIEGWEISTNGGAWAPTATPNTTNTQSYSNISQPTRYRVIVGNDECPSVFSTIATLSIHNLWTGVTDSNWNNATNWSGNVLPSPVPCPNIYIPASAPYQPLLSTGAMATVMNLDILPGASLTVRGNTMQIAGTITNGGIFDASNGSIEFNGATAQNIGANTFKNNALLDLVISNTTGVSLGGTLDVYRSLTYGDPDGKLNTGGFITLKSTAAETAWIGPMASTNIINGDVTVERYIPTAPGTSPNHPKSWQLLAIPTTGQTIKNAWQEGCGPNLDCKPKFGTQITGPGGTAAGFDLLTTDPSMKTYNSSTNDYTGVSGTGIPIYSKKGYFIFVRGDRSVITFAASPKKTTLRTTGKLFSPANPPPSTTVLASQFESVGNPYASAINLRSLSFGSGTNRINSTVIVWDPTLLTGSTHGLGAFQTLYLNGDGTNNGTNEYINLMASPAYGPTGTVHNNIQSGQAFFIQSVNAGGPLTFKESDKADNSELLLRPGGQMEEKQARLTANLYGLDTEGNEVLLDGALIQYSDNYSNSLDGMDARKMTNTSENLAIRVGAKLLVIERRHFIIQEDTIFLNLSGLKAQAYRFEFIASNLNTGLEGFLEDNYLHTRTPVNLSGNTLTNFAVENIAGSYAPDRFRIVFAPSIVLPVTFTTVKAYLRDKNINVEWKVENEVNIKQYEVEKSTNGIEFARLAIVPATDSGRPSVTYVTADVNPVEGYNYYRVKSVDVNGKTAYSSVVKVLMGSTGHDITIFPNPITDGMIHLQFLNQPEGRYGIRLLNKLGEVIMTRQMSHAGGSSTEIIKWNYNLAHGMYQLEVTRPDGGIKNINVLY